ncbi:MAG: hypothetical protein OEZ09_01695 [Betaproteobacteria bacterium]|nr:hypothetical protein [Betaproteobacteria bacterium]MDH4323075.1 hypothetical protein [Betaproteobacteria bacterium]MDH5211175.1 hypothetical protein [Betaproteobacteria bacterium]MDH5577146.1 hypothetical protein [Betaproteobacteria bacterium]
MRFLLWFLAVAAGHFVLSAAGTVLALRAAFETQASFWDAPLLASLAHLSALLLAPLKLVRPLLPPSWHGGFGEIAVVSVLVAAAAVALMHAARTLRRRGNA